MHHAVATVRPPNRQPFTLVIDRRIELGRECDGVIVVDSRVSRRHIALEPGPDGSVIVSDLGSSNGTILDGLALEEPASARRGLRRRDRGHSHRDRRTAARAVEGRAHRACRHSPHRALLDRGRRRRGGRGAERARVGCGRRTGDADGRLQRHRTLDRARADPRRRDVVRRAAAPRAPGRRARARPPRAHREASG